MFADRFEGSAAHGASRERLAFAESLVSLGTIKDEWDFVEDETLRVNIASELQKVHFDILLINRYNVYYSPEAMTMKHAIIAAASVAEAVLEGALRMIEDDPRVQGIIATRERVFEEFHELQLREFEVPDGARVVAGVQREVVRTRLDRNTKMDLLIRAARAAEIVGDDMEKKLQQLRRLRNRVHIKTVEELEWSWYTPQLANGSLDILEEFRLVAKRWIDAKQRETMVEALAERATAPPLEDWAQPTDLAVDDLVDHATLGPGVVAAVEDGGATVTVRFFDDGSLRRLMLPFAPMTKTGVFAPDDIPF